MVVGPLCPQPDARWPGHDAHKRQDRQQSDEQPPKVLRHFGFQNTQETSELIAFEKQAMTFKTCTAGVPRTGSRRRSADRRTLEHQAVRKRSSTALRGRPSAAVPTQASLSKRNLAGNHLRGYLRHPRRVRRNALICILFNHFRRITPVVLRPSETLLRHLATPIIVLLWFRFLRQVPGSKRRGRSLSACSSQAKVR